MSGAPGLTAIEPTARAANASRPSGPFQLLPPFVVLYSPTPASQPLPHAFGSPVPTQSVFALESFGSSSIVEVFWCSNPWETNCQLGVAASAFSVSQTPPFALEIQRRQLLASQLGSMAPPVLRPLKFSVPAL